jgi:hypothetical protein
LAITMRYILLALLLITSYSYAEGSDYWSKNKTMNLPSGAATTACWFYNDLDQSTEKAMIMNEMYKRWLKGWVSGFAMYTDWNIRDIEDGEYIAFIQAYCAEFPKNTLGMAAHAFTHRVKK